VPAGYVVKFSNSSALLLGSIGENLVIVAIAPCLQTQLSTMFFTPLLFYRLHATQGSTYELANDRAGVHAFRVCG